MMKKLIILLLVSASLCGCETNQTSNRLEQDNTKAAERLEKRVGKVQNILLINHVSNQPYYANFSSQLGGTHPTKAQEYKTMYEFVDEVRDVLRERGYSLVNNRKDADVTLEVRGLQQANIESTSAHGGGFYVRQLINNQVLAQYLISAELKDIDKQTHLASYTIIKGSKKIDIDNIPHRWEGFSLEDKEKLIRGLESILYGRAEMLVNRLGL